MAKKQKTNSDFVNSLLKNPNMLYQIFVIEAIEKWALTVLENKEHLRADPNPFINQEAWIAVAEDIVQQKEEYYKSK